MITYPVNSMLLQALGGVTLPPLRPRTAPSTPRLQPKRKPACLLKRSGRPHIQDEVGVAEGGQPVRDHKARGVAAAGRLFRVAAGRDHGVADGEGGLRRVRPHAAANAKAFRQATDCCAP